MTTKLMNLKMPFHQNISKGQSRGGGPTILKDASIKAMPQFFSFTDHVTIKFDNRLKNDRDQLYNTLFKK